MAGLVGMALSVLMGCSERAEPKLGMVATLSGRYSDLGSSGRNGAQLAFEEAKASKSAPMGAQLIAIDDEVDEAKALAALGKLKTQGVTVVIGPMTSNMAKSMEGQASALGMLLIAPTVTSDEMSGKDDHFVRVINTAYRLGRSGGVVGPAALGAEKVSLIVDGSNSSYAKGWVDGFKAGLVGSKARIVEEVWYDGKAKRSLADVAKKAMAGNPQMLVLVCNSLDGATLASKAKDVEKGIKLFGSGWAGTERLPELSGLAGEGMLVEQHVNLLSPDFVAFKNKYKARFGLEAGYPSWKGYTAAKAAIESGAWLASDAGKAKASLFGAKLPYVQFDKNGDFEGEINYVWIKNGRYEHAEVEVPRK